MQICNSCLTCKFVFFSLFCNFHFGERQNIQGRPRLGGTKYLQFQSNEI